MGEGRRGPGIARPSRPPTPDVLTVAIYVRWHRGTGLGIAAQRGNGEPYLVVNLETLYHRDRSW